MYKKGSYTLEAAFVVPIILGILFSMMYFAMYEHDKMILQGNVLDYLHQNAWEEGDLPNDNQWKNEINKHLWMGEIYRGTIKKQLWSLEGSGEISMEWKIPVLELFLNKDQKYEGKGEVITWQPSKLLRWKGVLPNGKK